MLHAFSNKTGKFPLKKLKCNVTYSFWITLRYSFREKDVFFLNLLRRPWIREWPFPWATLYTQLKERRPVPNDDLYEYWGALFSSEILSASSSLFSLGVTSLRPKGSFLVNGPSTSRDPSADRADKASRFASTAPPTLPAISPDVCPCRPVLSHSGVPTGTSLRQPRQWRTGENFNVTQLD